MIFNFKRPELSIVVIFYDMRREARRTLFSLSSEYQRDIATDAYEVIAIDNGSAQPLTEEDVRQYGKNFHYHYHETDSPSPVEAVNLGVRLAKGEKVAVIVDGARMASPGLIQQTLLAMRVKQRTFVASLAWHLGPDIQPRSIQEGYNQQVEDKMLASVDWQSSGYELFNIATLAPSSRSGFLGSFPSECSWFAMNRSDFDAIGGFDARFQTPGGGLCNHDFRNRVVSRPDITSVMLLGEGVFHQVHGGCATNSLPGNRPHEAFYAEYMAIKGKPNKPSEPMELLFFGAVHQHARRFLLMNTVSGSRE